MNQGYEMQKHRADILKGALDLAHERLDEEKARVANLEHSLADAMEQLETIQGTSQVHIDRVAELESAIVYCFETADSNEAMDKLYALLALDQSVDDGK